MEDDEHERWVSACVETISSVLEIPPGNIFTRLRQRKPGRSGQYRKHQDDKTEVIVREQGLKFLVNISDYLDTGLFLDHRITRQVVKDQSAGKKVLNLFSYTGAFSVYAAAGGASEVISVDLSKTYLNWAESNFELNGFGKNSKYQFIHADAKEYIKKIPGEYFDIIILDPPTFSNSKRMDEALDIQRDHVHLINHCITGLSAGGILYFSTNFKKFELNREKINASNIVDLTKLTTPFDFEGRLNRVCYKLMK